VPAWSDHSPLNGFSPVLGMSKVDGDTMEPRLTIPQFLHMPPIAAEAYKRLLGEVLRHV